MFNVCLQSHCECFCFKTIKWRLSLSFLKSFRGRRGRSRKWEDDGWKMDGQMDEHFQHYFTESTLAEHLLCKCSLLHFSVLNLAPPLYLCHSFLVQNHLTSCLNFHNHLMNLTYSLMSSLLCHDQDHLSNTKPTSLSCFTASTHSQMPTR